MSNQNTLIQSIASSAGVSGGGGVGQPTYIGLAYRTSDTSLAGGSAQDLSYTNKLDPNNMIDISGGVMKFTVPASSTGLTRIKTKLSPQSSFNATNCFISLPVLYITSGLVYNGVGDRINGTWSAGQNTNGYHFPYGELLIQLTPGTQYTVKAYTDVGFVNTGNGDTNFTYLEIW